MKYCENCKLVFDDDVCPNCYNSKLREPKETDFCLLAEKEAMVAQMLMEILKDNGIESAFFPVMGAGLSTRLGPSMERYRIYVPYEKLLQARELLEAYFNN